MRTLRLLVTVITRQPPRPVPLYFVDFASKPAWHAPFGFSHVFCQGSLAQSQTVRAKHSTPGMEALASDAIVKFSRFVTVIPFCGLNQIHCRKRDRHNFGIRTLTRFVSNPRPPACVPSRWLDRFRLAYLPMRFYCSAKIAGAGCRVPP